MACHSQAPLVKCGLFLLRSPSDDVAVEQLFRQALATAREQRAGSWELRAATSFGRLLGMSGRRDEARQVRADVLGRFTESHGSANLAELLAEFS